MAGDEQCSEINEEHDRETETTLHVVVKESLRSICTINDLGAYSSQRPILIFVGLLLSQTVSFSSHQKLLP